MDNITTVASHYGGPLLSLWPRIDLNQNALNSDYFPWVMLPSKRRESFNSAINEPWIEG